MPYKFILITVIGTYCLSTDVPPAIIDSVTKPDIFLQFVPTSSTPSTCPPSICPCFEGSEEPCNCILKGDPTTCTGELTVTENMLRGELEVVGGEVGNYEAEVFPTKITSLTTQLTFTPRGAGSCLAAFGGNPLYTGWHMTVQLAQRAPSIIATCPPTPSPLRSPSSSQSATPTPSSNQTISEENIIEYACTDGDSPYLDPSPSPTALVSASPSATKATQTPPPTPTPSLMPTPKLF